MYDLAILGGGPGGYVAAGRAGAAGLSVVLFEKRELGGVCLNEGCIPTKTLLYSAKVYDYTLHADRYGVNVPESTIDFGAIFKRKEKVVKKLVGGVKVQMRNANVEVVKEEAVIAGKEAGGFVLTAGEATYSARNILICTGSEAAVPPIPGLKEGLGGVVVTNREILSLTERPERLVVIGGGVIGMEFASFFNSIGTQVTVVEMLPKILGPLDDEISAMLQAQYAKKGVEFHLSCKVVAVEGNEVVYEDAEGNTCRAAGDKILVSVGRRASIQGIGLENIGVELALNPAGRPYGIKVDEKMRTSVPGVYAAGDVTGFSMLAHTASREGEVAVNTILGKEDAMSYQAIPGVVYTNPEVAGVGVTEAEAIKQGLDFTVLKLPMAFSGRFVAENERGEGLCKVIVDKASHQVLGVHMLGNPCSEIIQSACIAIEKGLTVEQLKDVVFPHPTVSEILKETLFTHEPTA
jgi:dihydrolipoamide dehydrogenase